MNFIDLFAGLGGFHLALERLGHRCVFASEIDVNLQHVYNDNFGIVPNGDIRQIPAGDIPEHDILCAGFPCQPFSKAGEQNGFNCPKWGGLFSDVIRIIDHHKPQYFILENVPNLERHDNGMTWVRLCERLCIAADGDYTITCKRLSPHHFGIPQVRERLFIVGSLHGLDHFKWPEAHENALLTITSALEETPLNARKLTQRAIDCLTAWQEFLDMMPEDEDLPSFPIWSMEFGATYPYKSQAPFAIGDDSLQNHTGSHGASLSNLTGDALMAALPSYARVQEDKFPRWKVNFIRQNRDFYDRHKEWIEKWKPKILEFPASWQKFEWNCKGGERNIWKYIIQFRASGVRVKRPTTSPSLVAMTATQVPIVAWQKRYMTPRECARLQGLAELVHLPSADTKAFKALGNAVNADLVQLIAAALIQDDKQCITDTSKSYVISDICEFAGIR